MSNITEKAMSVTSGPDKSLLRYFFGSWFHQDCTVEGDDWPEIVGEFRRQHAPAEAGQAADEIRQLLERKPSEEELEEILFGRYACEYDPRFRQSLRSWLEELESALRHPRLPNAG